MKPIGVFRRTTSVPSILKSKRPMGADSPRTQKFTRFSDTVEFATRGRWHNDNDGNRGVALIQESGTERLNGEGPLSFQGVVKDEVPDYESFPLPQARFLSILQKSESLEVASKLASAGAQVKAMQLRLDVCRDAGVEPEWAKKAQPYPVVRGENNDYVLDYMFLTEELYNDEYIADDLDKITRVVEKGTVALSATIPRPIEVIHANYPRA